MSDKPVTCDRCARVIEKQTDMRFTEVDDGTRVVCCPVCDSAYLFDCKQETNQTSWKYHYSCDL
jgi:hypothetical protein